MPARNRLRSSAVAMLVALVSAWTPAFADASADIAEYLSRLEKLGFAGSLVIVQNGRPVLARGYGIADRGGSVPWTPATVSTIGSLTKQFTGAAILALAEDGRVSVGDRIGLYLAGVPEDKQSITVHQLLTHTSGIVDLDGVDDWDPVRREEFVRRALAQELAFAPGESFEYSNAGYSLLGAIIERVTGETYEAYVRRRLLLPAGMYETGYILPDWGEDRLAQGYRRGEEWGTVLGRPMAEDGPFWALRANGGIHSTPWDMVRWAEALLAGDVLSERSIESYWSPHVDEGGGDSFYGYGWVVMDVGGVEVITHNGGNGIFFADMVIVPEAELIMVIMTNVVADVSLAEGLLEQLGSRVLAGEALPEVPDVADASPGSLDRLAGTYAIDGGGKLVAEASTGRIDIEAMDPRAFSALLSTRPVDHERASRLTGRINEIASTSLAGNYEPLYEAYGRRVPVERLRERWDGRLEMFEKRYGGLRTYAALGTAFRDGRDVTLVRLDFESGEVYRAYVWDPQEAEALLGVSQRGLDHVLHVYPEEGGGFASWDGSSGASRPVAFEPLADDGLRLVIDRTVRADRQRQPAARTGTETHD